MKIMMVTPYFYPRVGGLENYALNIAKTLQKSGHFLVIVTSNHDGKQSTEENIEGMKIIRLPISFRFSNTPIGLGWPRALKRIMKAERPDIVNAHTPVPGMADFAIHAAHSLKIPTTLTYHAATLKKEGSLIFNAVSLVYELIEKPTFRKTTSVIAVSDYVQQRLPRKIQAKTTVIYNAINPADTRTDRVNRKANRLIFIGSLDKTHAWKGVSEILRMIQIARKSNDAIELIIVGDGDKRKEYEVEAKRLGIADHVYFKGQVYGTEKYKLLRSAALLVAYPTTENDAFPTVFPEAWACSTPIIAADIGALSSILRGKNVGATSRPGDPKALAADVIALLADSERLNTYAKNGHKLVMTSINWPTSSRLTSELFEVVRKPRVCMIHNVISPYRLPIFEAINQDLNLHVIFPKSITKDRVWKFSLDNYTFQHTVLNGRTFGPLIFNANAVKVMLSQRFDVLVCNNDPDVASLALPAVIIAKLRRKKIVDWSEVVNNNVDTISHISQAPGLRNQFITWFIRSAVRRYRHIIFWFSDYHIGFSNGAIQYLHGEGVNDKIIMRTRLLMPLENLPEAEAAYYKQRTGKKVLYVGYLNNRKGVDTLIKAFMAIPKQKKATLTIAGTGPLLEELQELARPDKRISFVGYVEGQAKANLYASSDIFILPTLNDVWGLVIDEAIHYGLAVGCSTAAEAKELVGKMGGFLFPPQQEELLAIKLTALLTDPKLVTDMQSHNIRRPHIARRSKMADNIISAIRTQI